jgi:hypothetical protein
VHAVLALISAMPPHGVGRTQLRQARKLRNSAKEFAEKLLFSTSAPEGVAEKMAVTARLKASPDTNPWFFRKR